MKLTWLLRLTLVFSLMVILMGAYTRLSDAGLGCPDWPGCYGHIKVPTQSHEIARAQNNFPHLEIEPAKAWLEMIHRYIAGALGLLVLSILVLCLRSRDTPKKLPLFIAVLIVFQAALGMWTVTMKLMPLIVMSHLLGGFTLISLLLLLYLRTHPLPRIRVSPGARILAAVGLAALIGQIVLGGWTSSNYAALACTALPVCEGDWLANLQWARAFSPFQGNHPSFEFGVLDYASRMTIHVSHRFGALLTGAILLSLGVTLLAGDQPAWVRRSGALLICLLLLQIGLGVSNVVLHLPLGIAVSHNGGAALLLLTMVFINYALWRKA
ncbi:COX15/CtaA family protein [Shewanella salipaludis]|uniref:Heme A synthase n=1 Tax=Shewanella salipaludis TaxID=2723052 RepID=A0A972JME7_9GAMM|nr:COX15/CtaA family protein [Shewanella salipaludis]NMH65031.1 heme A synthase [Shewanella salipaludis]